MDLPTVKSQECTYSLEDFLSLRWLIDLMSGRTMSSSVPLSANRTTVERQGKLKSNALK